MTRSMFEAGGPCGAPRRGNRYRLGWTGAVAALAFVVTVGGSSVAYAGGTSPDVDQTSTTVIPAATSTTAPVLGPLGLFGPDLTQEKAQAILKLVREQMSPADQASLDELLAQADQQQTALVSAKQELDVTWESLNGLVDYALGSDEPGPAMPATIFTVGADWIFPVAGPHYFGDSFGAPRYAGGFHLHKGCDIMCAYGTPLVAVVSGRVTTAHRVDSGLGGLWVWLVGDDGNEYYYAHLSSIDATITAGTRVAAGQVLGYAGNTGDAKGGPVHLHFEIHPNGGPAIDPYLVLKGAKTIAEVAATTTTTTSSTTTTTMVPTSTTTTTTMVLDKHHHDHGARHHDHGARHHDHGSHRHHHVNHDRERGFRRGDLEQVSNMNKDFARRLASAKWVVPVAVLILTLSIGSIAFAVSGSGTPQKDTTASVAAGAGVGASGTVVGATTTATTPALVLAVQAAASATGSTPVSVAGVASPDSLAIDQVKENAILDLLRQKMSPADQATLDELRAQAAGEQTQLQQVQASLNATTQQIADLVNKYLGITTTTTTAVTAGQ